MLPFLIGLGALVGGVLLVAFWDDIVDWLKDLVSKLKSMFASAVKKIAHAAGAFIQKIENGLAAIRHKLYYQEEGEWVEETTTQSRKRKFLPVFCVRQSVHKKLMSLMKLKKSWNYH